MSNMEAFKTVSEQIQRELAEDLIKTLKEALAQTEEKSMTKDEIIRMAIESQLIYDEEAHTPWIEDTNLTPFLERFATLVASVEREACALICEELKYDGYEMVKDNPTLARKIRARGLA